MLFKGTKMKNKRLLTAVILPFAFIIGWLIQLNLSAQKLNDEVRIVVNEYDPRSLFSGNYMSLIVNWDETNCKQFKNNQCPTADFADTYQFFMPEDDAKKLDLIIRSGTVNLKSELVFKYGPGREPIIKTLLLNDEEWAQWMSEYKQK